MRVERFDTEHMIPMFVRNEHPLKRLGVDADLPESMDRFLSGEARIDQNA